MYVKVTQRQGVKQIHTFYPVGVMVERWMQLEFYFVRKMFPETNLSQTKFLSSFTKTYKVNTNTYYAPYTKAHTPFSVSLFSGLTSWLSP